MAAPSPPPALVARTSALDVLYWRALSARGETVLDPVVAELLFVVRWRRLPLRLVPCRYPALRAAGPLPAAVGPAAGPGGVAPRARLLAAAAAVDPRNDSRRLPLRLVPGRYPALRAAGPPPAAVGPAAGPGGVAPRAGLLAAAAAVDPREEAAGAASEDAAFCGLLRRRLGQAALPALLFGDTGIWEDYTRSVLARSAPWGCGWLAAGLERRRQMRGLSAPGAQRAALLDLVGALEALAERLGGADGFGPAGEPSALDACAYGHLAVLYSIPCEEGSNLHAILRGFPTLAQFCERVEVKLGGIWPDTRSFLAALPPHERAPAARAAHAAREGEAAGPSSGAGLRPGASPRPLEWWELWGWSWSPTALKRPEPPKARQAPPRWHAPAFAAAAVVGLAVAVCLNCGPVPPEAFLAALRPALRRAAAEADAKGTPEDA